MQFDPLSLYRSVCTFLIGGNVYFIKRLIDRIDATSLDSCSTKTIVQKLSSDVERFAIMLNELKQEIKSVKGQVRKELEQLNDLKLNVALLKQERKKDETKDWS